jgi:hypothetical protein
MYGLILCPVVFCFVWIWKSSSCINNQQHAPFAIASGYYRVPWQHTQKVVGTGVKGSAVQVTD